jgi:hypothetical protein
MLKALPAILLLALCSCTPSNGSLLAQKALCVPIGTKADPLELCAINTQNHQYSNPQNQYFLIDKVRIYKVEDFGHELQTYELLVSPSKDYVVAIVDIGEGFGSFYVANLENIVAGISPHLCGLYEAYPDGISMLEWRENSLKFTSTKNLKEYSANNPPDNSAFNYILFPEEDCRLELISIDAVQ